MRSLFLVLEICLSLVLTHAIMFNLAPNTQKCLKEEMQAHQIVAGEYEIVPIPGQRVDYVVRTHVSIRF